MSGFVPIEMPEGFADLRDFQAQPVSPEDWLHLLSDPLCVPEEGIRHDRNHARHNPPAQLTGQSFRWRDRVIDLDRKLRSLSSLD